MKIIIFDTEYLSLSKKYSDLKNLIKFKEKLFPEIIQISFLKCSNIYLKNNQKKLNIFIKIKQKIPKRITKLTNITSNLLQKKGYYFKESMNQIDKILDRNSVLLANGDDIKILKLNIRFNNIERDNKRIVNYVNFRKILNRIKNKISPGAVILLHDTSKKSIAVLKQLLLFLYENNYQSVTVDTLFNIDAYE